MGFFTKIRYLFFILLHSNMIMVLVGLYLLFSNLYINIDLCIIILIAIFILSMIITIKILKIKETQNINLKEALLFTGLVIFFLSFIFYMLIYYLQLRFSIFPLERLAIKFLIFQYFIMMINSVIFLLISIYYCSKKRDNPALYSIDKV